MDKFVNFSSYYGREHWAELNRKHGSKATESITTFMTMNSHNPPRSIKQCIIRACTLYNVGWALKKTVYTFGSTKFSQAPKLEFYSKPKIIYWQGNVTQIPHIAELFPYLREISVWQGRLEYINKQFTKHNRHDDSLHTALAYINSLIEEQEPITLPLSEDLFWPKN